MITLYSTPTANGQKVHIMLEETGLAYQARLVDLKAGEHRAPEILALNPMGKVPAILDEDGPDGRPLGMGETGAIAFYLARKAGRFGPRNAREAAEFDYWAHAINASLAPAFSTQFYFTQLAPERIDWAVETFETGAYRMLAAFEERLTTQPFMMGRDFSVIDALLFPHLATSAKRLPDGLAPTPALQAYVERTAQRPGVARGMAVLA